MSSARLQQADTGLAEFALFTKSYDYLFLGKLRSERCCSKKLLLTEPAGICKRLHGLGWSSWTQSCTCSPSDVPIPLADVHRHHLPGTSLLGRVLKPSLQASLTLLHSTDQTVALHIFL